MVGGLEQPDALLQMVGGGAARAGVVLVFGREAGDQTVPVAEFEQLGCAEVFVVEDRRPGRDAA